VAATGSMAWAGPGKRAVPGKPCLGQTRVAGACGGSVPSGAHALERAARCLKGHERPGIPNSGIISNSSCLYPPNGRLPWLVSDLARGATPQSPG
jgi:hypothetical protein